MGSVVADGKRSKQCMLVHGSETHRLIAVTVFAVSAHGDNAAIGDLVNHTLVHVGDWQSFTLGLHNGLLVATAPFRYELKKKYNITVRAVDPQTLYESQYTVIINLIHVNKVCSNMLR